MINCKRGCSWRPRKYFAYLICFVLCVTISWIVIGSYLELSLGSKFAYRDSSAFIAYLDENSGFRETDSIKIKFMTTYFGDWVSHWNDLQKKYSSSNCQWKCSFDHSLAPNNGTDADVLIFHAVDLARHPEYLPTMTNRDAEQIWLLLNGEGPWITHLDMERYNNVFNWTSFVRNDSDASLYYAKLKRKEKETTLPDPKLKKQHVYWLVSNCHATNHRDAYVDELKRHITVDVFSQSDCFPGAKRCKIWAPECDKLADDYNFYLAFENANCRDYITEKLWRGLERGVIPVVMGDSEGYKRVAPPGSYIDVADYSSPKKLADYLVKVERNISLYQSYFSWRRQYEVVDEWGCDLCRKLHLWTGRHQVYRDIYGWYQQDSCSTWNAAGHVYLHTSGFWRMAKRWTRWKLGVS